MTGIRPRLLWGLRGPGSTTGSLLAQCFQLSALLVPLGRWERVCRTDKRGRPSPACLWGQRNRPQLRFSFSEKASEFLLRGLATRPSEHRLLSDAALVLPADLPLGRYQEGLSSGLKCVTADAVPRAVPLSAG